MNPTVSSEPVDCSAQGLGPNEQHPPNGKQSLAAEVVEQQQEQQPFLNPALNTTATTEADSPYLRNSLSKVLMIWWLEVVKFDGKEQPSWKYSINLNTLIAILSTLLRVCMMYGVEEALSQMKWLWYRRPRSLRHLAHFDAAVRGPAGSFLLLVRLRQLDYMLAGCLVIVFSIGIGPFTQQAVKTVPCDVLLASVNSSMQVAQTNTFLKYPHAAAGKWDLDLETKLAILQGLANPNGTKSAPTPDCVTGNCSFSSHEGITHSSIGLCKKCVDVTPWLYEVRIDSEPSASGDQISYGNTEINLYLPFIKGNSSVSFSKPISVGGGQISIFTNSSYQSPLRVFLNSTAVGDYQRGDLRWLLSDSNLDKSFMAALPGSIANSTMITLTSDQCDFNPGPKSSSVPLNEPFSYNITCAHPLLKANQYWHTVNAVAAACIFYPCIKDYTAAINDTVLTENLVKETPFNYVPEDSGKGYYTRRLFKTHCIIDRQLVPMGNLSANNVNDLNLTTTVVGGKNVTGPRLCLYAVDGNFLRALSYFLVEALTGLCRMPHRVSFRPDSPPSRWNDVDCDGWWLKGLYNRGNATFGSIDSNMEAIAVAATSEMRKQGSDWDGNAAYVQGTVSRTTVCTQFDWVWMSFPVVLLMLTMLMLVSMGSKTMSDEQHTPTWKSSTLPLLFTGNGTGVIGASKQIKGIEKETDDVVVKLVDEGGGWIFSGERTYDIKEGRTSTGSDQSSISSTRARVLYRTTL